MKEVGGRLLKRMCVVEFMNGGDVLAREVRLVRVRLMKKAQEQRLSRV
jgi:hypothetical protein